MFISSTSSKDEDHIYFASFFELIFVLSKNVQTGCRSDFSTTTKFKKKKVRKTAGFRSRVVRF